MKHQTEAELLEYWFTVGMSRGLSFDDSVKFAENNSQ